MTQYDRITATPIFAEPSMAEPSILICVDVRLKFLLPFSSLFPSSNGAASDFWHLLFRWPFSQRDFKWPMDFARKNFSCFRGSTHSSCDGFQSMNCARQTITFHRCPLFYRQLCITQFSLYRSIDPARKAAPQNR